MTETIQQLKEDIAILQEKLRKLEEQEPEMLLLRQGKVDIVDYDGKKYLRIEYTDSFDGEYSWYVRNIIEDAFVFRDVNVYAPLEELYQKEVVKQKEDYPYKKYTPEDNEWKNVALEFGKKFPVILPYSYNELSPNLWYKWAIFVFDEYVKQRDIECGYTPNQKEQEPEEPVSFAPKEIKELVKEGLEWCEENPDKDPLDYLTPKTPEETEESLKEAFREAQQTEKWKRIQQKIDDGYFNDFIFIDRPNLLDFLKDKLGYSTDSCYEIVDAISEWLPETQNASGSQNAYVESAVEGWNDAINAIRGKLQ